MLHIYNPEYIWFFLYTSLFATFTFNLILNKSTPQDFLILYGLLLASIFNTPIEIIQHYTLPYKSIIFESTLFISSLALITRAYSKTLLFYLFCITTYFTSVSISHSLHLENIIIPMTSLLLFYSIHKTCQTLLKNTSIQNSIYCIFLIILSIQTLLQTSTENIYYFTLYAFFALYLSIKAFISKGIDTRVFYAFFSFLILTTAHTFCGITTEFIAYTLFYVIIAYFLYHTSRGENHILFALHSIIAMAHICYTFINPSYFLIHTMHSQILTHPALQLLTTLVYCIISLSIILTIPSIIRSAQKYKTIHYIKCIYITVAIAILVELQIFHKILNNNAWDISYVGITSTTILYLLYLIATYTLLTTCGILFKKFMLCKPPHIALKIPRLNIMHLIHFNSRTFFYNFGRNLHTIHTHTFTVIPAFLFFYLLISFLY
ncbi:MAG: hypothetical protein ACI9CD_001181 [Candidatus Deianiraeaceae bacterium]|jgi:hypothetical protein